MSTGVAPAPDPLFALFRSYCALYCLYMGRTERAMEHALQTLDVDANHPIGKLALGEAYSQLGRHEDGIGLMEKAQSGLPRGYFYIGFLAQAYVCRWRRTPRRRSPAADRVGRTKQLPVRAQERTLLHRHGAGRCGSSLPVGRGSIDERDPNISLAIRSPYFQPLRSDPRYDGLLRRMNLQT